MKIPQVPPTYDALVQKYLRPDHLETFGKVMAAGVKATIDGRYRHFEKLRHIEPPEGLTLEQWWLGIKLARQQLWKTLPLTDTAGHPFKYAFPDEALAMGHQITQSASGNISIREEVVNPDTRERYIVSSLIEEAITSSQLEGAATTTPAAKELIRSGRKPRDDNERMILNNYRAIREIRDLVGQPLTPQVVFQIHRTMTEGTDEAQGAEGRLRRSDEYRIVAGAKGETLHEPPPADELPERLQIMCDFANDRESFVFPVLRAIILHFWLAYDHPFVDGNGRTARALFYWSMLSQGYWLTEYLSISSILKKAPARYARSYLYVETDENDLTYFVMFQLEIIVRAIKDLHAHLRKKASEVAKVDQLIRRNPEFNHRQLQLLGHALRHPGHQYTVKSHQTSHNVAYETARSDLMRLAEKQLLRKSKVRQKFIFVAPEDLNERLRAVN